MLPGVELVVKSLLGPVTEDMLLLDNVGTSLQVCVYLEGSLYSSVNDAVAVRLSPELLESLSYGRCLFC